MTRTRQDIFNLVIAACFNCKVYTESCVESCYHPKYQFYVNGKTCVCDTDLVPCECSGMAAPRIMVLEC